jgi:hypothetical protein
MGGIGGVPPGSGGTPPPSNPGGGGGDPNFEFFKDAAGAAKIYADSNLLVAKALEAMTGQVETADKKIAKFRDNLRGSILIADNTTEALKLMTDQTKGLARAFLEKKGFENAKKAYEGMIHNLREMVKDGKANERQIAAMNGQIAKLVQAEHKLNAVGKDLFEASEEGWKGVAKDINGVAVSVAKLNTALSQVKMGKIGTAVAGVRQDLITSGLMKAGKMEKFMDIGMAGTKLRELGRQKKEAKTEDRAGIRAHAQDTLLDLERKGHVKLKKTGTGEVDWAGMAAMKKKDLKGVGGVGGNLGTTMNLLADANTAPRAGLMSKLQGGGLVQDAIGKGAELAGQFALPLAIAETIKDLIVSLIDKNAAMNKQAEAGGGGLGAFLGPGSGSGADTMLAIRNNLAGLRPGELFSKYGLGYDRNIKMAQSIQQSGYLMPEIGEGGAAGAARDTDFGPGAFGDVQKIAATSGRMLGMSDDQSIQMTMKLLMQYRESMEGTQSFFTNLTKDSRAAGISATKYVSIIDEILSGFDMMNKSLDQVTGTMRVLSRTGRGTSEDLQAMMQSLTGAGRAPLDTASMTFAAIQMKKGGGQAGTVLESAQEESLTTAANQITKSLGKIGINYDAGSVRTMMTTAAGRDQLRAAIDTAKGAGASGTMVTNAYATVDQGQQRAIALDVTKKFMKPGASPLDWSTGISALKDPQIMEQVRATLEDFMMQKAGYTREDMISGRALPPKLKLMLEGTFQGFQETDIAKRAMAAQNAASGRFGAAAGRDQFIATGKPTDEVDRKKFEEAQEAQAEKLADELGKLMPDDKEMQDQLKAMRALNPKDRNWVSLFRKIDKDTTQSGFKGKIIHALSKSDGTWKEILDGQDTALSSQQEAAKQAEIDEKAQSVASATQDTAEIFANVFSTYFNKIIGILEQVRTWMAHSKFFGGLSEADEKKAADLIKNQEQNLKDAKAANLIQIDWLKSQKNVETDPIKKAQLQARIDSEQKKRDYSLNKGVGDYGVNSGRDIYQAQAELADAAGELGAQYGPLTEAMGKLNKQADAAGDFTLSPEEYKRYQGVIDAYPASMLDVKTQKDASGNVTNITIHEVHNSVDIQHQSNAADIASRASSNIAANATSGQTPYTGSSPGSRESINAARAARGMPLLK